MGKIIYNGIDCGGGSGGGVDIEPNPSEAATDTLEKLGIDGTIYNFEGTTYPAGTNIQINENVISATDTTYSAFQGTDGTEAGSSGLVPSPAATDTNKYLKSDGTWATVSGGGGGNVYGAFIDTNRVIVPKTMVAGGTTASYTAVEDCAVVYECASTSGNNYGFSILIDDVEVGGLLQWVSGQYIDLRDAVYVKKGQTIKIKVDAPAWDYAWYKVYGLTQGTQGIFSPIIYSEEEREVGVWVDNKPLYQITYDAGSNIDVKYDSWTNITINELMGSENIVMGYGTNSGGTYTPLQVSWTGSVGSKIIQVQTPRNSNNQGVRYFTFLYTKSADTAGSGKYNTLGAPTVAYKEGVEYVVGTYTDSNNVTKPLYQKTCVWSGSLAPNQAVGVDSQLTPSFVSDLLVMHKKFTMSGSSSGQILDNIYSNTIGGKSPEVGSGNIGLYVENYTSFYIRSVKITVRYTKTTD